MSAPRDIIHQYTDGLCWNLASALHELTGLPVWAVFDSDGCEVHGFVFDKSTSTAYDIRGALTIPEVIQGPWKIGKTISPFDLTQVSVTKRNASKAKTIAKRYLNEQLQLSRSHQGST